MPDVAGKKLDVAYEQIKDAGIDDEDKIKVDGGGLFGIVRESNWTVCTQSPVAGKVVSGEPKLTVKRSCKKKSHNDTAAKPSPSPTPTNTPTEEPEPTATTPAKPKVPDVLTAKNNDEFAALLKLGDNCSDKIARFAKKYPDQKFRFDGSIADFAGHADTKTRFDMLVGPGDYDENSAVGPSFQFYDKNFLSLNLTGDYPDNLAVGQQYTFTAKIDPIDGYNAETCLLRLEPVETKAR